MRVVSDFVGKTRDAAKAQIVAEGLVVGTETAQNFSSPSDELKNNKIVDQTPDAGTSAQYESKVDLIYGVFSFSAFGVFGFVPTFSVFSFTPVFNVFSFVPFSVFGFSFSVFSFTPVFSVFGFSFAVFSFTPTFAVFGFR